MPLDAERVFPPRGVTDRAVVMFILNVTPDSFSDGGAYPTIDAAVEAVRRAVAEGAEAIDIGGESTRPGAARIGPDEQVRRVVPVIEAIRAEGAFDRVLISIDTTLNPVARAALDAGADAINDVSAGLEDPAILTLAAQRGCGLVLMHRLAPPGRDSYSDRYPPTATPDYSALGGVVPAVRAFLAERAAAAEAAGIPRGRIVLDPGLGFGKTVDQNLELIRRTGELASLGYPILSGVSRKSFTARAAGLPPDTPPRDRLAPTLALTVAHRLQGASIFRVHDVAPVAAALRAVDTLRRAGEQADAKP